MFKRDWANLRSDNYFGSFGVAFIPKGARAEPLKLVSELQRRFSTDAPFIILGTCARQTAIFGNNRHELVRSPVHKKKHPSNKRTRKIFHRIVSEIDKNLTVITLLAMNRRT